ncbi:MAG TPA: glycerophosphodiester phosphodiesterase [Dehalococcoidia bacterium]|nr:glycerophosphodiester phosphodiesterase [Dehalococcoidia bacterium]
MSLPRRPLVIGHKGAAAVAPENTLASFAKAMELGAGGLECDIRATSDGVPVIIHDATLDRTTDARGEVAALTLAQVKAADASLGMPGFRGERVPTLEELLTLVAGRCLLALEFKTMDAVGPSVPILREHDAASWCTAWAFNAEVLRELKRLLPGLTRTQNVGRVESWEAVVAVARELECVAVSLEHHLVDAERVASAHEAGLRVYCWTANQPEDWGRLIACEVDGITTDDPGGLIAYLDGLG